MAVRFAEACKPSPLLLETPEAVHASALRDKPLCHTCQQDIFLGFFFDGTNNNKYRDTPIFAHSNVARLYEAYAGVPTVMDKLSLGKQTPKDYAPKGDLPPAWPGDIPTNEKQYYRKTYVPGVGTPFIELGDSGEGMDQTLGLAMAKHGEVRLDWALWQIGNQICAALTGKPLSEPLKDDGRVVQQLQEMAESGRAEARATMLEQRSRQLAKRIAIALKNKPTIRKVRLAVFGFSRGAAEARVFCNWALRFLNGRHGGLLLQIDFLGIFDTVASVGLAHSMPWQDGHYAWAQAGNLAISSGIKRCVHLVAAHEVRGSFPLDSASGSNVKEVVYPGVHSDIGGGYPPNDQGRAVGRGAAGDQKKLSQIPLAQMYREALIAGVPLVDINDHATIEARKSIFKIDPDTIQKFNAYIEQTRQGKGKPDGKLWLTETQAAEPLETIMHRHYGYFLQWRRGLNWQAGQQKTVVNSPAPTRAQDQADFKNTDALLKQELAFVTDDSLSKYATTDDPTIEKTLAGSILLGPIVPLTARAAVIDLMRDKQKQWDGGMNKTWQGTCPPPCATLFDTLMHDSRAWFKPFDTEPEEAKQDKIRSLQVENRQLHSALDQSGAAKTRAGLSNSQYQQMVDGIKARIAENDKLIAEYQSGKRIALVNGGHEPYRMWGYLRWRKVFTGAG